MLHNDFKKPTIEDLDREIQGGFRLLRFSPRLENHHEEETRSSRELYMVRTAQLAIILFNLFLATDYLMIPDVFRIALYGRCCIVTPMFLAFWFVVSRRPPRLIREGVASLSTILSVFVAMTIGGLSRSPDMVVYQTGNVLILVFSAVVLRLPIRYACVTMLAGLIVQVSIASHVAGMTPQSSVYTIVFFVTASIFLLAAAYTLEREQRRSYLLDLRNRMLNERLERISRQDALTGLWNRRYLETVVAESWGRAATTPIDMAAILVDIDHFKAFNDSYGHLEGDQCLKRLAACLEVALAGDDRASVVRFGGEEFVIFIENVSVEFAMRVAERIGAEIKAAAIPHPALGAGRIVTASLGVATGSAPGLSMSQLVAKADDALYRAKRAGRNCIRVIAADVEPIGAETERPNPCRERVAA